MGIKVKVQRNETGRIYGITFIDHNSKTVWNGSRLGKELSANVFNAYWQNSIKAEVLNKSSQQINSPQIKDIIYLKDEEIHPIFQINQFKEGSSVIEEFGSLLLPDIHGEDFEELDFENKIKKAIKNESYVNGSNCISVTWIS